MIIEEILHLSPNLGKYVGLQMILSIFKDDFPWIYDAGHKANSYIKKYEKQ